MHHEPFLQAVVFPSVSHVRACINKEGQRQVIQNTNTGLENLQWRWQNHRENVKFQLNPKYQSIITKNFLHIRASANKEVESKSGIPNPKNPKNPQSQKSKIPNR